MASSLFYFFIALKIICMQRASVIDAVRISDGETVMLKRIEKSLHPFEVEIAQYLRSEPLASDPRNNCCSTLEVLEDPRDDDVQIMVMPLLRTFNWDKFTTVGEAIGFFHQAIEV